jgi:hypothetical protein
MDPVERKRSRGAMPCLDGKVSLTWPGPNPFVAVGHQHWGRRTNELGRRQRHRMAVGTRWEPGGNQVGIINHDSMINHDRSGISLKFILNMRRSVYLSDIFWNDIWLLTYSFQTSEVRSPNPLWGNIWGSLSKDKMCEQCWTVRLSPFHRVGRYWILIAHDGCNPSHTMTQINRFPKWNSARSNNT